QRALEILIFRGLRIDAALSNDGAEVVDFRPIATQILDGISFTPAVFHIEAFEIGGPPFVNPHVCRIGGSDAVAEPLVPTLVNDDEVESRADSDAGPILA